MKFTLSFCLFLFFLSFQSSYSEDLHSDFLSQNDSSLKSKLESLQAFTALENSYALWLHQRDSKLFEKIILEDAFDFYAFPADKFQRWALVMSTVCLNHQLSGESEKLELCVREWNEKVRMHARREPALKNLRVQLGEMKAKQFDSDFASFLELGLSSTSLFLEDTRGALSLAARQGDIPSRIILTNYYVTSGAKVQALAWIQAGLREGAYGNSEVKEYWEAHKLKLSNSLSKTELELANAQQILAHSFSYSRQNSYFQQSPNTPSSESVSESLALPLKNTAQTESNFRAAQSNLKIESNNASSKSNSLKSEAYDACFANQIEVQAALRLYSLRNDGNSPQKLEDLVTQSYIAQLPRHQPDKEDNLYHTEDGSVFCELHGPYESDCPIGKLQALCKSAQLRQRMFLQN